MISHKMMKILCRNFEKNFLKWEKMASRKIFQHFLRANFFMFILLISTHTVFLIQFAINLYLWVFQKAEIARTASASAISAFWKTHKCKLIPNWTRKTVWLLINNINMKKCPWRKCWKIFLEAIFLIQENLSKFHHHFMWYHWLRKFPFVFQPIITQNYDV